MQFSLTAEPPSERPSACLIVGVYQSGRLSAPAQELDDVSGGALAQRIQAGDMDGRLGRTLLLHGLANTVCERVLLVGLGKPNKLDARHYRKAVVAALHAVDRTGAAEATCYLPAINIAERDFFWQVRSTVEAIEQARYRFYRLKTRKHEPTHSLVEINFGASSAEERAHGQRAIAQASAIAAGVKLAKDLANLPGNICTPSYLAEEAHRLAVSSHQLTCEVLDEEEMQQLGMGALLSVSRGSRQRAKLIVLDYRGGRQEDKPIVLVGKGLTFDAGGISLKPAAEMDEMKFDMSGAASVLGTLAASSQLALPLNVVGVIPSSENLPDGAANKPGDIVTSMSGQTIEILNTDAEGRLILCDAITYSERFEPDVIVDIATLTGACVVALGNQASGLFTNHQALADALLSAGTRSEDRAWQLPLWNEYQEQLKSNFADMANIGGRGGGAVTAACFLARFTKRQRWAHLDIAGTASTTGKEKGATGRPVALLTQYLIDRADAVNDAG
jgi:leucyl aminopeptidase